MVDQPRAEERQRRVGISTAELPPGATPRGPWRLHHWPIGDYWVRLFRTADGTLYGAGVKL